VLEVLIDPRLADGDRGLERRIRALQIRVLVRVVLVEVVGDVDEEGV
jgi:hypothetical protein